VIKEKNMDTISISAQVGHQKVLFNFEVPSDLLNGIKRYFENGQKIPITLVQYIKEYYDLRPDDATKILKTMIQGTFSLDYTHKFRSRPQDHKYYALIFAKVTTYYFLIPYESDKLDDFYTKMTLPAKSDNKRGPSDIDEPDLKHARKAAARLLQDHDIETAAQMLAKIHF
jgi:hypothetical protein